MKLYILIFLFACLALANLSTAQGIIIPTGGHVIVNNGNIVVNSNWANNGNFTHNAGTIIFAGSAQTLGGTSATIFNNITVMSGSTTTITTPGHILNKLLLSNGTLNANGNLTLHSTAAQTAAIDGSGSGEVLGTVIMQRYLSSGFGYKYFSSPFQNDTVGSFANDIDLHAGFPTFYKHDENLPSDGWITYTTGSGVLNPMHGYAANLGTSTTPKTVDLEGVVNNHTVSRTLYNHGQLYTQGFNLVGNPYPSPINWDAAGGWTKTNIDNAVYYFNAGTTDQYTGIYSSYVNGISSDGTAGNIIAAMQGFFVHVSDGAYPVAGQLVINNNARTTNPSPVFFKNTGDGQHNLLRLTASFNNQPMADAFTLYLDETASGNIFNKKLDALKLLNTDAHLPNLYSISKDSQHLSIQALSLARDSLVIVPLTLAIKTDGHIQFNAKEITGIPEQFHIYLHDAKTGMHHDLRESPVCNVTLTSGNYENRFFIKFSIRDLATNGNGASTIEEAFKMYVSGGKLFVNALLPLQQKANLRIVNMAGQVIWTQPVSGSNFVEIPINVASGVYVVQLSGNNKNPAQKIFIGR